MLRPRLAARVTSVNLESTRSSSRSTGGSIMVGRRSAIRWSDSSGRPDASAPGTVPVEYTGELGRSPFEVVVDHHVVSQLPAYFLLFGAVRDPPGHAVGVVAPGPHPGLEVGGRGRHHENEHRLGVTGLDLAGPV